MKICLYCCQFITLTSKRCITGQEIRKLLSIMNRYDLSPEEIIKIIGVTRRTFFRWLQNNGKNIKAQHFELLKIKGYC